MQENSEIIYAVSRRLEAARQKAIQQLSKEKWATVGQFLEQCQAEGLTKARILRLLYDLTVLGKMLDKNFEDVSVDDVKKLVAKMEGSHYSYHSKYGCALL